ncbi:unnamed protein product [Moneuplotes crassus]|uniref:Uncharacterized protein n=1 Tax=Euplotes crassus TaxID=5936 RepID=A0AAD1XBC3_EUPCR|nr:unnamed protein product [Moneuplotes crassus]
MNSRKIIRASETKPTHNDQEIKERTNQFCTGFLKSFCLCCKPTKQLSKPNRISALKKSDNSLQGESLQSSKTMKEDFKISHNFQDISEDSPSSPEEMNFSKLFSVVKKRKNSIIYKKMKANKRAVEPKEKECLESIMEVDKESSIPSTFKSKILESMLCTPAKFDKYFPEVDLKRKRTLMTSKRNLEDIKEFEKILKEIKDTPTSEENVLSSISLKKRSPSINKASPVKK